MTKDLTVGNPLKLIFAFLIPLILGELMQQIYSLVDAIIVGRSLGVLALGGVGATGSLSFLVIGFCNGICSGFSLPVAQAFGAGDTGKLRRYVSGSTYLCIAAGALLLLVLPFTDDILYLMKIPQEQYDYAYDYIFVIFCGIPTTLLYNMTAGIIRSLGDSKTPVYFLALCSVLNIIGDLVFIRCFHTGVEGAAWATVVSQLISGLLCFFYMRRKYPILKMQESDRKPRKSEVLFLLSNGIPMGLQFSITAVGSVILQSAVNTLGAVAVSAMAATSKVFHMITVPYQAVMNASATFTGQNLGAKKFDRIRQGAASCGFILLIYWILSILFVKLTGDRTFLIFLSEEDVKLISRMAMQCLKIYTWCGILLIPVNVLRLAIQGMSFSKLAMVAGLIEMLARMFIALAVIPRYGFTGACYTNFCAWVSADAFLIPAFFVCLKIRERQAFSGKETVHG